MHASWCNISNNVERSTRSLSVIEDVEGQTGILASSSDHSLSAHSQDNCKMSTERLDDTVAAITFAATIITIGLGFLFNL